MPDNSYNQLLGECATYGCKRTLYNLLVIKVINFHTGYRHQWACWHFV